MQVGGHHKLTVRDVPLHGRTVLVRADYNVPLDDDGAIADDFRIRASLPTLRYLVEQQCKIIILSHLGRPEGQVDERYSLEPVAERLHTLLGAPVKFVSECVGDGVSQAAKRLHPGQVILCENVRFHSEETANDAAFAKRLAADSQADYFVQDGFGVVHRAHASTSAITQYLPSVAGLLLEREYTAIRGALDDPNRPFVAVLGGAKVSDKIALIERFVGLADQLVIGGAMANTFLKYRGVNVGASKVEDGLDGVLERIYVAAEAKVGAERVDDFLLLPTDGVVAAKPFEDARRVSVDISDVAADELILDLGQESIVRAVTAVQGAKTVVWNGTLGMAELPQFSRGSARMALALASLPEAVTIVGGGDTADFVLGWDQSGSSFSHVSTGGGASLELMAGAPMPGIDALLDANGQGEYTKRKV